MARTIGAILTLKDKDFSSNARKATSATKDLERKVKHTGNSVKRFGDSATSGFKRVGEGALSIAGAIGITKALSSALNLVKDSIGSAFTRIDTMERFERVMTTLTGSTETATKALEATNEAVLGTAYGLDVAAKGVQDFVTRGVDIEKSTERVAAWGDAVAFYGEGSNEQLSSVMDALAKMTSKGKVDMQQMNRLFDAGIDAVGMYAQATGRSTEEVQSDLSKGAISAEDFIDTVTVAMMEGTNGVENISGAAKEAGATWGASFDNMKAAVARGTVSIVKSIDEMLESNGLPDMRSMVSIFGKKFEESMKRASDKVPIIADKIQGMYEKAKPTLDWLKDTALPAVSDAIGFVTDKATDMYNFISDNWGLIGPVVAGVIGAVMAFKTGVTLVTTAQNVWAAATTAVEIATGLLNGTLALSPMTWVAIGIGAVITAAILLYKNWDKVKEKTEELWAKFKETKAFSMVTSGMENLGEAIDKVKGFFGGVKDKFDDFKSAITSFSLPDWVTNIGSKISNATSNLRNQPEGNFAVGTNRVRKDMLANIHKDEMIIPASKSHNLRNKGVNIDNIDKGGLTSEHRIKRVKVQAPTSNQGMMAELKTLINTLLAKNGKSINIAKLADSIIVREEADIDKIANAFVKKIMDAELNMI